MGHPHPMWGSQDSPSPGAPAGKGLVQCPGSGWGRAPTITARVAPGPLQPPGPVQAVAQRTHKPDGAAQEGVEVAATGVDAALGTGAALQPGLQAVHHALPDHDLGRNRWLRRDWVGLGCWQSHPTDAGHRQALGPQSPALPRPPQRNKPGRTEAAGAAKARLSSISSRMSSSLVST